MRLSAGDAGRGLQLALLTLAATSGIYARTTIGPIQETMRAALSLSDNQMALLQGPALALPLAIAAIPLGLAVDRYSRAHLLLIATLLNTIASATTALVSDFSMLFFSRCLVGLAAPASAIAAYSLLADLYAPTHRGRATMVVALGQVAGSSAAFALGGELLGLGGTQPDSWRWAMLGMACALLPIIFLALAIKEPPRSGLVVKKSSLRQAWPELRRYRRVIVTLVAGFAMVGLADGAAMVWAAPTFARIFGLPPDRIGAIMAAVLLAGGVLGPVIGGILADFCLRTGGPRQTISVLIGLALLSVPSGAFALMPSVWFTVVLLILMLTIGAAISVMVTSLALVVIPNELRGLCVAIKFSAGTLFGLGLAPLTVSLLAGVLGAAAMIGKALMLVCVTSSLLGAVLFTLGRPHFSRRC